VNFGAQFSLGVEILSFFELWFNCLCCVLCLCCYKFYCFIAQCAP